MCEILIFVLIQYVLKENFSIIRLCIANTDFGFSLCTTTKEVLSFILIELDEFILA